MSYRKATRRLAQAGLLATAAGLLAAGPAAAQTGPGGSAYGLTVTGPVKVPPVPAVSSTSNEVSKSLLREDSTKLVKAAVLDVKAQRDGAYSKVARLKIPAAGLTAEAVSAKCLGGRGVASVADGLVAGKRLAVAPPPNTTVPVEVPGVGKASVILNKQQRMADGRLSVTALEVNLPVGTVRVASATCGRAAVAPPSKHAEAPAPSPVKGDLPVTG